MPLPIPDPDPAPPLSDAQLADWDASRDLKAELLESVQQYKRGEGRVVYPPDAVEPKRSVIAPP